MLAHDVDIANFKTAFDQEPMQERLLAGRKKSPQRCGDHGRRAPGNQMHDGASGFDFVHSFQHSRSRAKGVRAGNRVISMERSDGRGRRRTACRNHRHAAHPILANDIEQRAGHGPCRFAQGDKVHLPARSEFQSEALSGERVVAEVKMACDEAGGRAIFQSPREDHEGIVAEVR
jgi:hypothetical protein